MKKLISALFLASLATSSFAGTDDRNLGGKLVNAASRIEQIVGTVQVQGTGTGTGAGSTSGSANPWHHGEDDFRAVPKYKEAATTLKNSGYALIDSDDLEIQGRFAEALTKRTQACARTDIALAQLATANNLAKQPGFSMTLAAFGPELTELLLGIQDAASNTCNF